MAKLFSMQNIIAIVIAIPVVLYIQSKEIRTWLNTLIKSESNTLILETPSSLVDLDISKKRSIVEGNFDNVVVKHFQIMSYDLDDFVEHKRIDLIGRDGNYDDVGIAGINILAAKQIVLCRLVEEKAKNFADKHGKFLVELKGEIHEYRKI